MTQRVYETFRGDAVAAAALVLAVVVGIPAGAAQEQRPERRIRIGALLTAVAFSADGTEVVAWDPGGFSRWNVQSGRRTVRDLVFAKACDGRPALPRSEDGRTIGVNCQGRLHFFDLRTGRPLGTWQVPKEQGVALYTASPDGRLAAVVMAGALDVVDIRHLGGGGPDTSVKIDAEVERLSVAPGATRLGVGTFRGVGVRQLPDGTLLRTIDGRSAHAVSDDGTRVAVETAAGATIVDLQRDEPLREVDGRVSQLRFGREGQLLIGWNNQSAFVWDLSSGARLMAVSGEEFVAAALSEDGTRMVTVSLERRGGGAAAVVEIWRVSK